MCPMPFLKPKSVAGVIVSHRKPDGGKMEQPNESDQDHAMEAAAEDIIRAISSKDSQHLAHALRSAFEILQSEPDKENSFDEQNEKAAEFQEE